MSKERAELLQLLIEKLMTTVKSLHGKSCLPMGEFQISQPQVMIVFFLAKHKEGVSTKDIASFLHVTSGAVTQFIDVLVEKKLVQREEDQHDRRIVRLTLTKFAEDKLAAFKKKYYKTVRPAFDDFSKDEMEQFIFLLTKIKQE